MCPSNQESPAARRDSTDAAAGETLARGAAIGRFIVLRLLGKGGMGEVYAAYDPELDRNVAIKLLRSAMGSDSAEARMRLMREAQAIARVSHPNVVVVFDAGTFNDRVFIAMELVEGTTLGYWMHARKRSWPEVLEVFVAAGRGLAAAHERQLVHRDFKPDNVMVGADGQVRVMDFGLVQVAIAPASEPQTVLVPHASPEVPQASEDIMATRPLVVVTPSAVVRSYQSHPSALGITQAGTSMGTPAYMSPEQFRGQQTDARTDQFSFCVALYEALYGERPFEGNSMSALEQAVIGERVKEAPAAANVPEWIRLVLLKGLRSRIDERWPSMNALLAELDKQPAVASRRRFAAAAADRLAGIWDTAPTVAGPDTVREEVRRAFSSTGKLYAAKAYEAATAILDRYARRWCEAYVEACEATQVRGDQSAEVLDLRMGCLQEGLDELKALCQMFRTASPEVVENAVIAASALGNLERCDDIELLRAVIRPPQDESSARIVSRLRRELADARALHRVGRLRDGLMAACAVERGAREVNYLPLLAETLMTAGQLHQEQGSLDLAAKALEEAVWVAVLCRHDEAAAEAAICLVFVAGHAQTRFELGEVWSRMADSLIQRMGGHYLLHGWLLNNRGAMRESQGRLADALTDARLALEMKEKVLVPGHHDLALSLSNLAITLDSLGQLSEAVEHTHRAVQIVSEALGPDHPLTALMLSNYGELLARCDRFDEAAHAAGRALIIFERETDPQGLSISYPLLALGLSRLGQERGEEALPLIQRAHDLRIRMETAPAKLGEVRFALARALWLAGGDRARAASLAIQAQSDFAKAPGTPAVQRDISALQKWLDARC